MIYSMLPPSAETRNGVFIPSDQRCNKMLYMIDSSYIAHVHLTFVHNIRRTWVYIVFLNYICI